MNKGIYILLLLIGLTSCSEDVVFNNNAAFQGVKDNVSWKAADANAMISGENSIELQAVTINETVTLKIPLVDELVFQKDTSSFKKYKLGINETTTANYTSFLNGSLTSYETGASLGGGEIVITDYDGFTISGKFRFNAENTDSTSEPSTVNFQHGVFYKVPIAL